MSALKIFISSTSYDLSIVRSQLRTFILSLGHEPVMSDFADVLYDPRQHTHTSCLREVENCDMLVLIIGSRFGGRSVPQALDSIKFDQLKHASRAPNALESPDTISITQLEVLRAIQSEIPIFTFVETRIMHDHLLYEKNKDKPIIDQINFPSIEKPETAKYIFEFINFLRLRAQNNSIADFSKIDDIETNLRKQ